MINPYQRYQTHLSINEVFPTQPGRVCSCGCGKPLPPKRSRWSTKECEAKAVQRFLITKGDTWVIRKALFERDKGACVRCGEITLWDADHIIPVHKGGGGCGLDNLQTLCRDCHREKTLEDYQQQRPHQLRTDRGRN